MAHYPTKSEIRSIFSHLSTGDTASFYTHVSDNVSWTVMGSNALSGHYTTKASFLSSSWATISKAFDRPMILRVTNIIGGETEEWVAVELETVEMKCKNGMAYDQKYIWSMRWSEGVIVEVRAYLDGQLLDRALRENGISVDRS